jgi:2-dehydro-3-deoxygalactonokinase
MATPGRGKPAFVAVDWGTSNFRAYLADAGGNVLDFTETARGILTVKSGEFTEVLKQAISGWCHDYGPMPVMMSGMVGSRQGWVEAPYVRCPAGIDEIARHLKRIKVDGIGTVHLVPGLDHMPPEQPPDVMRGEEAQTFGAIQPSDGQKATFVHPGTHSKWVTVSDGVITGFTTYMTGEVYAALKQHTILGRLMTQPSSPNDGDGFLKGVAVAHNGGMAGDMLHHLFSVRTLGLFDQLPGSELAEYLSGILIGAEIAAAAPSGGTVTIFGNGELTTRYGKAADALGLSWKPGPADSVVVGQLRIARAARLL